MSRSAAIIILLIVALACHGQQWSMSWISHPDMPTDSQTVFWKEIIAESKPQQMIADIACNGRMAVYVNGYNATVNVMEPSRAEQIVRYDITRFMRRGRNIIAVWTCPPCNGSTTAKPTPAIISCSGHGIDNLGNTIIFHSDSTWKCRTIKGNAANGNEWVYGVLQNPCTWSLFDGIIDVTTDRHCISLQDTAFNHCAPALLPSPNIFTLRQPWHKVLRISNILPYTYFDDMDGSVRYYFARWFDGWVRVTLRGMHRGDTLNINGLHYICTGRDDEQACRRFSTSGQWMAIIQGDSTFNHKRITNVEGIEIDSCAQTKWSWY